MHFIYGTKRLCMQTADLFTQLQFLFLPQSLALQAIKFLGKLAGNTFVTKQRLAVFLFT